ncbi:hypothetical protein N7508_005796 [Penicillium antarcticum]|uniref:uncharacterized protein n=1 Tax=Penicillium antarcticum TaxID=416450 RepID=UPI0023A1B456|nr:uncharacterized protein N7508_005796 [Penicillium antarcticum]KAJ5306781.1 hypothetical protein N7508_005796 [Penicillium antarcticum]
MATFKSQVKLQSFFLPSKWLYKCPITPRVALYRNTLKNVANSSSKKYPLSNESILKGIPKEKKACRPISPVVDFYNIISIEHAVPAGAFDLPELHAANAPLEFRLARPEDIFVPLDAAADEQPGILGNGEILYAQGNIVLTRHMAWLQSKQALATDDSTEVMFMSEVLNEGEVGAEPTELSRAIVKSLQDGLRHFFGIESRVKYLGKSLGQFETGL